MQVTPKAYENYALKNFNLDVYTLNTYKNRINDFSHNIYFFSKKKNIQTKLTKKG